MRAFSFLTGIPFQVGPTAEKNIAMLDSTILVPAISAIMVLVVVAGVSITVQKHKRY